MQAGLAAGLHLAPPRHDDDHDSDRVIPVRYRVAVPVVSEQRPGIDHAHVLATLQDALR